MDWNILGIEPTRDKKTITNAYRMKLQHTNPEDKPEEFKALRAAYEEALRLAAAPEAPVVTDDTPTGRWLEQVKTLYADFPARIVAENWTKLLRDPVCTALDTRVEAEQKLLHFLNEHYFLPQKVWIAMDEMLSFQSRLEELYEICPRPFVDQVILNGIRFSDSLAYELFLPGKDGVACDAYREIYYEANQTPPDQIEPLLQRLEALPEQHPYGKSLRLRQDLLYGDQDAAIAGFRALAETYPDDEILPAIWAQVCLNKHSAVEAEAIARGILEKMPRHNTAKRTLAEAIARQGRYKEAKEIIYDLLHEAGGDPVLRERLSAYLKEWNEDLIQSLEQALVETPGDTETIIELAWCYIQNMRMEEAKALALKLDPGQTDAFDYHNLLSKLYHNTQCFSDALPHLYAAVELLRELPDDGTEKTRKRRNRLPEFLQLLGHSLYQLEKKDEAMTCYEEALSLAPDDPEVLSLMSRILYADGNYNRAEELIRHLIHLVPDGAHNMVMLSLVCFRLHRDRDAFEAIQNAIHLFSGDLSSYVVKMYILLRNGVHDEVRATLDFLKENNAPESLDVEFIRARLAEEDGDKDHALREYQRIAKLVEQDSDADLLFPAQLYFHMAFILGSDTKAVPDELIALTDQGLAADAQDEDCLSYKAWILGRTGRVAEAIDLYKKVLSGDYPIPFMESALANLYSNNLSYYAEEALEFYNRLLQHNQTPELCFYKANCLRYLGDREGASRMYRLELELDPQDEDGYNGLAYLAASGGDLQQALKYVDLALSVMEEAGQFFPWLVEHRIQILRRMGDWSAALAAADDAAARFGYEDYYQRKFDICCQFGQWDKAKQVLEQWKQGSPDDDDQIAARARYHLLRGEMLRSTMAMAKVKHRLPPEQIEDYRLQLNDLECEHERMLRIRTRRAEENPEDDYALMHLAESLWRTGRKEEARKAAQKALALIDKTLELYLVDEALFRTRRSLLLAILGREEEARESIDQARKLPLCEYCEYGKCKDADVFEAMVEEILGDPVRAKELYEAGKKNWPDEPDFTSGLARLKKKGK